MLLDQHGPEAPHGRIARDAGPRNAPADDEQIGGGGLQLLD
jgi:hypothetical protein